MRSFSFFELFLPFVSSQMSSQAAGGKLGCKNNYKLAGDSTAIPQTLPPAFLRRIRSPLRPRNVLRNHRITLRGHRVILNLEQTPQSLHQSLHQHRSATTASVKTFTTQTKTPTSVNANSPNRNNPPVCYPEKRFVDVVRLNVARGLPAALPARWR